MAITWEYFVFADDSADSFEPVKVKRKAKKKKSASDGPAQRKRKRDDDTPKEDV